MHGAQHEGLCWAPLARRLARAGRPVLTPDLPGHGANPAPALDRVESLARWLLDWLAAHEVVRPVLIGHSLGSLICLHAAATSPAPIHRLVLLGAAVPLPVAGRLLESAANQPARAMASVNRGSHTVRGWLASPSPLGLWAPGLNLRMMERQSPDLLHRDLAACNDYAGGLDAAARIRCPTLVIVGSEDRMTPPGASDALLRAIAGSRRIVLPAVGHALLAEAPQSLAAAIEHFLGDD